MSYNHGIPSGCSILFHLMRMFDQRPFRILMMSGWGGGRRGRKINNTFQNYVSGALFTNSVSDRV